MLASQLKHEFDVYNQGVGATPAWTMTVMGYSNDYINVIRIDSSNKWLGEPHKSLMGKMWSIIVETKKPFQNLDTFRELIQAGFNIDVTPVSKGQNKRKEGIRIYSMKQEPNEELIGKLLDYIFEEKTI